MTASRVWLAISGLLCLCGFLDYVPTATQSPGPAVASIASRSGFASAMQPPVGE